MMGNRVRCTPAKLRAMMAGSEEISVAALTEVIEEELDLVVTLIAQSGLEETANILKVECANLRKAFNKAAGVPYTELLKLDRYICSTRSIQYGPLRTFVPCPQLHAIVMSTWCQSDLGDPGLVRRNECVYAKDTRNVHAITPHGNRRIPLTELTVVESAPMSEIPLPVFAIDRIFNVVKIHAPK